MRKNTKITIKPEIKAQIQQDILDCDLEIQNGAVNAKLFRKLEARYSLLDKNFFCNMPNYVQTIGSNYKGELEYIKARLETYLMLDCFPVEYNGNVAVGVNIQAQKIVNKGNIGNNNDYNKSTTVTTEVAINSEKRKKSLLEKLFRVK